MHTKQLFNRTVQIGVSLAFAASLTTSVQAKVDAKVELNAKDLTSFGQSKENGSDRPSLTVIGIDAGEWTAINYMRSKGLMPNMDRLIRGGAYGKLESIHPMFTPVVWTTIATGKAPILHGIRGFRLLNPDTGKKIPVNRTMRRTSAIWNLLTHKGLRSLIVGWYATWPAEKIKGTMISDYTWPLKNQEVSENLVEKRIGLDFKEQTYPRSLYHRLEHFFIDKFKQNPIFASRFDVDVKDAPYALKHGYAKDLSYFRMYGQMRKSGRYDFTTLYLQGTDLLSHQFWREFSLLTQGKLKPGTSSYKKADYIVRYYKFVDEILGVYEKNIRKPNETVMIVSDHGFEDKGKPILLKVSDDKYAKQQFWHRKQGIMVANGPKIKAGTVLNGATIFDIAPTILSYFDFPIAQDMQGAPISAVCGCDVQQLVKIKSYEDKISKKMAVRESPYDQAILKSLNEFGYIQ